VLTKDKVTQCIDRLAYWQQFAVGKTSSMSQRII